MADDSDGGTEWASPGGLGGAKDGNGGFAEEGCQMHWAAIVTEDEAGVCEPVSKFKSRGFS